MWCEALSLEDHDGSGKFLLGRTNEPPISTTACNEAGPESFHLSFWAEQEGNSCKVRNPPWNKTLGCSLQVRTRSRKPGRYRTDDRSVFEQDMVIQSGITALLCRSQFETELMPCLQACWVAPRGGPVEPVDLLRDSMQIFP